jgi:hypothetical protein
MGTRPLPADPLTALTVALALALALAALAIPATAGAADPGHWRLVRAKHVPLAYNQGVTTTATGRFTFTSTNGLFATSRTLVPRRDAAVAIPPEVTAAEGYDHVGDLTYDRREGGRLLLPLECFKAGGPNAGNHCGTGAIAVVDPATLAWRYYVKLDPRDIKKAMWAEVSPDGRSLWTQAGSVLLRYSTHDISRANAAPTGRLIRPRRRVRHALPPGQMTGAAFSGERLYVATQPNRMRVWSIDLGTGKRRLEIERSIRGESEGLTVTKAFGGTLQWLIAPFDPKGRRPTYGSKNGALLTFAARR